MLSKKKPTFDDLENYQPIQVAAKDTKACYVDNIKGVAGKTFANFTKEIKHNIY